MAKVKFQSVDFAAELQVKATQLVTDVEALSDSIVTEFNTLSDKLFGELGEIDIIYNKNRDTLNSFKSVKNSAYKILDSSYESTVISGNGIKVTPESIAGKALEKDGIDYSVYYSSFDVKSDNSQFPKYKDFNELVTHMRDDLPNYFDTLKTYFDQMKKCFDSVATTIEEFNAAGADMSEAANNLGLNIELGSDGISVLGVKTTVDINGESVEMSTSEAMNAFFTYTNTVMSGEIAADYMARTYDVDINYEDIVRNANSFMSSTINSGLYTNDFINTVLPTYSPSQSEAEQAVANQTGLSLDEVQSVLNNNSSLGGELALYAGLLGAGFVGKIKEGDSSSETESSLEDPNSANSWTDMGGYSSGSGSSSSGSGGSSSGNSTKPGEEDSSGDENDDNEAVEIPEEVNLESAYADEEGNVDYDQMARDEYEFGEGAESIIEHRTEIIRDIDDKLATGDYDSLRKQLKEYGYSDPEIEAILQDREKLYRAILEGDEKQILAEKAQELAKADGIEDYDTSYDDRPDYKDLDEEDSELLALTSEDEDICELKEAVDEAKEDYAKVVEETNEALKEFKTNKESMEAIAAKYTEKYGEDTTKWTNAAIQEYNEAVKTYNASAEKITEQLTKLEESKTAYKDAYKEFVDAKEEYYEKLRSDNTNDSDNSSNSGSNLTDTEFGGDTYVFEDNFITDPNMYGDSTANINPGNIVGGDTTSGNVQLSDSSSGHPYIATDDTSVYIRE